MTKKNYAKAAEIVRDFRNRHSKGGTFKEAGVVDEVANQIENSFIEFFNADDNPRFDVNKFRQACRT